MKRLDAVLGKVNLPAGVSSRAMVVMFKRAFIVICSPGASPLVYIDSVMNTFYQGFAGWNPVYKQSTLCVIFLLPWALKCWCGTIATMFSQAPRRDSQDLSRFSLVDVSSRW